MARILAIAAVCVVLASAGCGPVSNAAPGGSSASNAQIVFTKWVPDAKADGGPEPGYRPALSGLTGHDIKSAVPAIDATGTTWVVNISFKPSGTALFAELTRENVAACPGDPSTSASANCAQRHLAIWVGLMQGDVDRWDDVSYVAMISGPFDLACVSRGSQSTTCAKFISDPITLEPITGGAMQIGGAFTRQSATDLAAAINSRSGS